MDNYSDVYPKQKTMLFHFRAETSAVTLLTVTPIASTECFRADVQSGARVDQHTRARRHSLCLIGTCALSFEYGKSSGACVVGKRT